MSVTERVSDRAEKAAEAIHEHCLADTSGGRNIGGVVWYGGTAERIIQEAIDEEVAERVGVLRAQLATVRASALDYEVMARDEGRARQGDQFEDLAALATAGAPGSQEDAGPRCPVCGSKRIVLSDCQDCGFEGN